MSTFENIRIVRNATLFVCGALSLSGCLESVENSAADQSAFVGEAANRAPEISGTPRTGVVANQSYSFEPQASDADDDALTFSVAGLPGWATFNGSTGRLSGTPSDADIGVYSNIRVSVSDGAATAALAPFSLTVSAVDAPNSPPIISGTPRTDVNAGSLYLFVPTTTDVDNDALTYAVSRLPIWARFNDSTGRLSGTPAVADIGSYSNISISVTDGEFTAMLPEFSITVSAATAPNSPPAISGTPSTDVDANSVYSFTPTATDPDGDSMSFAVSGLPGWANFNDLTGRISGTPGDADIGVYSNIQVSVTDGSATAELAPFSISVNSVVVSNSRPEISGTPATSVDANSAYAFRPTASDPDGDALAFSISGLPAWANFSGATGRISGTPADADVGVYSDIRVSVSDGSLSADLAPFSIAVNSVAPANNTPPAISGTPPTSIDANSTYSFTPTSSDADGDSLTFSVSGLPGWANFNNATGRVSGTPGDTDVGVYANIRISVSDGSASADLPPFSITVNSVAPTNNTPPAISGTPPISVDANNAYSFTPTSSDADGDSLTFSVSGLPVWANFDNATGRVSGTPGDTDVGVHANIRISVSDGFASADLPPFSITVNAVAVVNTPPVISGSPPSSVEVNSAYSFAPTASDADGDSLTFSVSGLPVWANFDNATGRLSGTPGDADVGVYSNIRISVSDGNATANLASFSITVNAISIGSVTLSWTAPTKNNDDSPLLNLDKYRIYWGTEPGNYPNSVTFDANTTTYVVEDLPFGTYEFVATSINSAGVESAYSSPTVTTVSE